MSSHRHRWQFGEGRNASSATCIDCRKTAFVSTIIHDLQAQLAQRDEDAVCREEREEARAALRAERARNDALHDRFGGICEQCQEACPHWSEGPPVSPLRSGGERKET